jgi:tetratricopeptide (TPR) repeat protein
LEKGRYDDAIEKAAKKLRKNPNDSDELYVLKEAFEQANMFDEQRIQFLEAENREENWLEIYLLYSQLKSRQDVIRSLPSSIRNQFALVNYNDEIIQSKESAAEALYQQGLAYLDRGDRRSARLAYDEFIGVTEIYPDYKDDNQLFEEAG